MRLLAGSPDLNQRAVASAVGTTPSRIVALLDELEEGGLLERARRADDRRSHVVRLTAAGRKTLADVGAAARAHDAELMSVLTPEEREDLHRLLQRVANANGLSPRIHPGYRTMPERQ
ncbi:MAG: MarR family winged helix-turn-helix transcriptional regulator [Actinomycetota bacterium]|nr:MarR family winged helix-turn-helix transcriptional regulator [Actinomycetota bacterium]